MNSPQEPLQIEVSFYAKLRQIAGTKSHTFSLAADSSIRHLLDEIVRSFPELQIELFDDQGALYSHVRLLINGHDLAHQPEQAETHLQPGDKISLFPAIGGG